MPRRPRRAGRVPPGSKAEPGSRGDDDESPVRLGPHEIQEWPDGEWAVRQVPGSAAV